MDLPESGCGNNYLQIKPVAGNAGTLNYVTGTHQSLITAPFFFIYLPGKILAYWHDIFAYSFMKKSFVLFVLFVVSVSAILLTDIPYLATTGKMILIMAIAIAFEIFLMDTTFFNRKTRSALRKNIDDHPYL